MVHARTSVPTMMVAVLAALALAVAAFLSTGLLDAGQDRAGHSWNKKEKVAGHSWNKKEGATLAGHSWNRLRP
ncbi:MAG: hypothetical protein ACRDV1_05370 [Actinomycetes bacterium]